MNIPSSILQQYGKIPKTAEELASSIANCELGITAPEHGPRASNGLASLIRRHDLLVDLAHQLPSPDRLNQLAEEIDQLVAEIRAVGPLPEPSKCELLTTRGLDQIVDIQPENQIVTVQTGVKLSNLQSRLREHGQCLPIGVEGMFHHNLLVRIRDLIDSPMPHSRIEQHGSWRDWVLAMELVLPNGKIVKSGAKVVKSVTGFDLHKLVIGARGTLGIASEVTLKTCPLASLIPAEVETKGFEDPNKVCTSLRWCRVLPSNWVDLCYWIRVNAQQYSLDHISHQAVYCDVEGGIRPKYDHMVSDESDVDDSTKRLMLRAKQIFDPTNKLNPGEFPFL